MRTCQVNKALNGSFKTFRTTPLIRILLTIDTQLSIEYHHPEIA